MRCAWTVLVTLAMILVGCSDDGAGPSTGEDAGGEGDVAVSVSYTDWSEGMTGTTAKPAYGKGCRYRAVDGEVWEWPSDGENDRITVSGPASGEVASTLYALDGASSVMLATVTLQRSLPGKAYYQATGSLQFGGDLSETWTVIDGTLCFEVSLVDATQDVAGEFSFIAQEDAGTGLRTVGGTFTVSADAITGSDPLNVNDQSITLDIR